MNFSAVYMGKGTGEIHIYGSIGESFLGGGITSKIVIDGLSKIGRVSEIDVRINSEGGDIFEGVAIYQALLRNAAKITVHIDSLAASAASVIAMAGKEILIAENAFTMIHNPWSVAMGDEAAMRKRADLLASIKSTIVDTYAARTGQQAGDISEWMDAETWMDATTSLERGFATGITENLRVAARLPHPEMFSNVPRAVLASSRGRVSGVRSAATPMRTIDRVKADRARAERIAKNREHIRALNQRMHERGF